MIRHLYRVAKSLLHEHEKRVARSPKWEETEKKFKAENPTCAACGGDVRIQIHHIQPFHLRPELELDPTNLISLCMGPGEHHLIVGHGDDFKAYNPNVVNDAAELLAHPDRAEEISARAKAKRRYNAILVKS